MTAETELYAGPDLENAFERSRLTAAGASDGNSRFALLSASRHAVQTLRGATLQGIREIVVRGTGDETAGELTLRYVGTQRNLPFLLHACLDTHRIESDRALRPFDVRRAALRDDRGEDLLLLDTDCAMASLGERRPNLRMAPWLKQRMTIPPSWSDFLDSLPAKARRNIARCLRKYGYTARVEASEAAFVRFYRQLYRPHVSRRFGSEAVVVDETSFVEALRGAQLIELIHEGEVVAANSIRLAGQGLWILWYGASDAVTDRGLKGVTEVLDYFSILLGARSGCSLVDLGRARPRLNDGPLVYKAKWRTRLELSRLQRPPLVLVPRNLRPATARSLARGQWICRVGKRLQGVLLVDSGSVSAAGLEQIAERAGYPGLSGLRVCALHGLEPDVDVSGWRDRGIEVVDLRAARDPLAAYAG